MNLSKENELMCSKCGDTKVICIETTDYKDCFGARHHTEIMQCLECRNLSTLTITKYSGVTYVEVEGKARITDSEPHLGMIIKNNHFKTIGVVTEVNDEFLKISRIKKEAASDGKSDL